MSSKAMEFYNEGKRAEIGRQNVQFSDIINLVKENMKICNETVTIYRNIIYDEVRKRLEDEGFSVKTISCDGKPAYSIKVKEWSKSEPFPEDE